MQHYAIPFWLRFQTPPQNQGQIATESYALDLQSMVAVCHIVDASDRTEAYFLADLDPDREYESWCATSGAPEVASHWRTVTVTFE